MSKNNFIHLCDEGLVVVSLYRSLSSKNFSTFGRIASKISRHWSWSNACNTSPNVPPSCMYISSIAFVSPSFGRTQVSTHLSNKSDVILISRNFTHHIDFHPWYRIGKKLAIFRLTFVRNESISKRWATSFHWGRRDAYRWFTSTRKHRSSNNEHPSAQNKTWKVKM